VDPRAYQVVTDVLAAAVEDQLNQAARRGYKLHTVIGVGPFTLIFEWAEITTVEGEQATLGTQV